MLKWKGELSSVCSFTISFTILDLKLVGTCVPAGLASQEWIKIEISELNKSA